MFMPLCVVVVVVGSELHACVCKQPLDMFRWEGMQAPSRHVTLCGVHAMVDVVVTYQETYMHNGGDYDASQVVTMQGQAIAACLHAHTYQK
jgi:hypothetical protein